MFFLLFLLQGCSAKLIVYSDFLNHNMLLTAVEEIKFSSNLHRTCLATWPLSRVVYCVRMREHVP